MGKIWQLKFGWSRALSFTLAPLSAEAEFLLISAKKKFRARNNFLDKAYYPKPAWINRLVFAKTKDKIKKKKNKKKYEGKKKQARN